MSVKMQTSSFIFSVKIVSQPKYINLGQIHNLTLSYFLPVRSAKDKRKAFAALDFFYKHLHN